MRPGGSGSSADLGEACLLSCSRVCRSRLVGWKPVDGGWPGLGWMSSPAGSLQIPTREPSHGDHRWDSTEVASNVLLSHWLKQVIWSQNHCGRAWRKGLRPGPEMHSIYHTWFLFNCRNFGNYERYKIHHISLSREKISRYISALSFFYDYMQFHLQNRNHMICILFPIIILCPFSQIWILLKLHDFSACLIVWLAVMLYYFKHFQISKTLLYTTLLLEKS